MNLPAHRICSCESCTPRDRLVFGCRTLYRQELQAKVARVKKATAR